MKKNDTFASEFSDGVLAQLARAFDWQSRGREFDSHTLHRIEKTGYCVKCTMACFLFLTQKTVVRCMILSILFVCRMIKFYDIGINKFDNLLR